MILLLAGEGIVVLMLNKNTKTIKELAGKPASPLIV